MTPTGQRLSFEGRSANLSIATYQSGIPQDQPRRLFFCGWRDLSPICCDVIARWPSEIVRASGRGRDRFSCTQHARDGRIGGARKSFRRSSQQDLFRTTARHCKRHHWSSLRPNRRIRLASGRARRLIGGHRQRDGNPAEAALDFALDVKRKLAGAELGEMNAIPGAQSANLSLIIRLAASLAGLINEALPDVDIDDPGLLGPGWPGYRNRRSAGATGNGRGGRRRDDRFSDDRCL